MGIFSVYEPYGCDSCRLESLNETFRDNLNSEIVIKNQQDYVDQHIRKMLPNAEVVPIACRFSKIHLVSVASGGQ